MSFDPYQAWLGVPPHESPPNFYQLLGLPLYESNADIIINAADRQMIFVRQFQGGPYAAEAQRLLDEIVIARGCLLDPLQRSHYDVSLFEPPAPAPPAVASPPLTEPPIVSLPPPPKSVMRKSRRTHSITFFAGHLAASALGLFLGWWLLQQLWASAQEQANAAAENRQRAAEASLSPPEQSASATAQAATPQPPRQRPAPAASGPRSAHRARLQPPPVRSAPPLPLEDQLAALEEQFGEAGASSGNYRRVAAAALHLGADARGEHKSELSRRAVALALRAARRAHDYGLQHAATLAAIQMDEEADE